MTVAASRTQAASLVLPGALLLALLGIIGMQSGMLGFHASAAAVLPDTVVIASRTYSYRAGGEYVREASAIDGPLVEIVNPPPLEIMTYQVSAADYAACVTDGACEKASPKRPGTGDVPVTGVSFRDATAYAQWMSAETGDTWRLPTLAEWAFAAGSKADDPALGLETDGADPAERWLAQYEREAELDINAFATPTARGTAGLNEFGVADLSGAVWEWTATCDGRTTIGAGGEVLTRLESCGVRFVEGRHRAAMTVFVRDAQGAAAPAARRPTTSVSASCASAAGSPG